MEIHHNLDCLVMEKYLQSFCDHLSDISNADPIELTRAWARTFPKRSGVYSIFDKRELVYVGESGSVRGRMMDLLDSRHHVLRRNLGSALFRGEPEFISATSKTKFPPQYEAQLNDYIQSQLKICVVTVSLGRKEIEEWLIESYDPTHNKKRRRTS